MNMPKTKYHSKKRRSRKRSSRRRSSTQRGGGLWSDMVHFLKHGPTTASAPDAPDAPPPTGKAVMASLATFLQQLKEAQNKRLYLIDEMLQFILKPFDGLPPASKAGGLRLLFEMLRIAEGYVIPKGALGQIGSFFSQSHKTDVFTPKCLAHLFQVAPEQPCLYNGLEKTLDDWPVEVVGIAGLPETLDPKNSEPVEDILRRMGTELGLFTHEHTPVKRTVQALVPLFGEILDAMMEVYRAIEKGPMFDVARKDVVQSFRTSPRPNLTDAIGVVQELITAHPHADASVMLHFRTKVKLFVELLETDPLLVEAVRPEYVAAIRTFLPSSNV